MAERFGTVVEKFLLVGGWVDDNDVSALKDAGVTHILTVCNMPPPKLEEHGFVCGHVSIEDQAEANLLRVLPEALAFLSKCREAGGVAYVHCHEGISRAPSVCIAFLMRGNRLSYDTALTLVRKPRPQACPNDGFASQLREYGKMNCDPVNGGSASQRLERMAASVEAGAISEIKQRALDPAAAGSSSDGSAALYSCKKCRRKLFLDQNIAEHEKPDEEHIQSMKVNSRIYHRGGKETFAKGICTSLFIEPMEWMTLEEDQMEGKLSCPKCSGKLGTFKWIGIMCSCGAWVTPAFQIASSNVDKRVLGESAVQQQQIRLHQMKL